MVDTSLNHLKILAIHKTSQNCMWLRYIIQHIWKSWGLSSLKYNSIILHALYRLKKNILRVIELNIFPLVFLHTWVQEEWWDWCLTNKIKSHQL